MNIKHQTKLALIVGLLLDYIEELNTNNFWIRKVKSLGNNLKKELIKYDNFAMKGIDINTSQDFINGYQAISNLIDFNLSLSENQTRYFEKELNQLISKYKK